MDRFAQACADFGLTISVKKTNILCQDTDVTPEVVIENCVLEVVHQFTYLGSTISDKLSLKCELDRRIGMAASTFSRLTDRVWKNSKLTTRTKIAVYHACVVSTLLYCSEAWTTYATEERRLNAFHMRCLRRILGISWRDRVTNATVLEKAGIPSMYSLLRERRLRWLGHVCRMDDGRIPKDVLYGELVLGKRSRGRPRLRYKDACKRDMKAIDLNIDSWEELAKDRSGWRHTIKAHLPIGDAKIAAAAAAKRARARDGHRRSEL